jgi:hypothetical protein
MTHAQELTLAIASLLQLSPLAPAWDEAHKRVGELKKAYVDSLLPEKQTTTEPEAEPQPEPAPTDDEQKAVVAAVIEKAIEEEQKLMKRYGITELPSESATLDTTADNAKPRKAKAAKAKVGGVKSKEKVIVDMNAAELKALAKKNNIDSSTVNFRKADEKDAFRSKLAKALGRSSELNYSVK